MLEYQAGKKSGGKDEVQQSKGNIESKNKKWKRSLGGKECICISFTTGITQYISAEFIELLGNENDITSFPFSI